MLIPLANLYAKYKIKSTGIVHVGAHWGEEFKEYARFKLRRQIWVEADPDAYAILMQRIGTQPGVTCVHACIGEENGKTVTFNVSNNDGQSSSYLPLGHHKIIHPEVKYIKKHVLTTSRMDKIFTSLTDINFLAIDVQGAELQVLKSMGMLLDTINYIYLEVNKKETYKGCALVEEIDAFLIDFARVETAPWVGDSWSDAFYIRRGLKY